MILALLLAIGLLQDDVPSWILQLESESLAVREEATRRLNALGLEAVGRLEKARDEAKTPELRARLDSVIAHIRKMSELSKAFGPTRRVTVASRGRLLKEVLASLKAPFVSAIDTGDLDEEARIDVQVRDASWWEALDRVVHAAGARYRLEAEDNGQVRIKLARGKVRDWPVLYADQFRVSVREATQVESRILGEAGHWAMLMVELHYQPDLKPHESGTGGVLQILSIHDAKGVNVKDDQPRWAVFNAALGGGPVSFLEEVWVRPKAVMPLTVTGTTDVLFPSRRGVVELDIEGAKSKAQVGPVKFEVVETDWQKDESRVRIRADAEGVADLADRLLDEGAALIDSKGERYPGEINSRRRSTVETAVEWELVFTGGITAPKRVSLPWIEEFHNVQIPFRLEGVRLPELTSK